MNINVLNLSHKDRKDFRQERKVFTIKPLRTLRFYPARMTSVRRVCDNLRETYFEIT
jgi:hypothetical protein